MLGLTSAALLVLTAAPLALNSRPSDIAPLPAECIPGVAGYNFDVVSGVHYTVDVTRPVGQRVLTLTFHDKSVAPTDTLIMALNNYRQSGGGGYAMLRDAPVVYDKQQDIRQLLIEEVQRLHEIHEVDYRTNNWSFVKPGTAR